MKLIFTIILICICCHQSCFPFTAQETEDSRLVKELINHRNYVCYKFGTITVIVIDGEDTCDILVMKYRMPNLLATTVKKEALLKWTFEDMRSELEAADYHNDDTYSPFSYELSFVNNNTETFVTSTYRYIVDNDELVNKLGELKDFIIKIWLYVEYEGKVILR